MSRDRATHTTVGRRPNLSQPPDEKLAESAPLQWRLAHKWCDESCAWYHGPRGYLRALGIMRGLDKDSAFLAEALATEAARLGSSRVLISGAADYAMLAHVAAAYAAAGQLFEATLVDRCRTPLTVNAWYAAAVGLKVHTIHSDILDVRQTAPFDLIATHSFFSFFDEAERLRLVERWRRLLRPGGSVVTAHGVYRSEAALRRSEAARVRVYRKRARDLNEASCRKLGVDRQTLMDWVETHNHRRTHRRVKSVAALRRLFEHGGFRLTDVRTEDVSLAEGVCRVRLVAERLP